MEEDKIVTQDKYGNKVTISKKSDGSFYKVTRSNMCPNLFFMDTYSYELLYSSSTEKSYWYRDNSSRSHARWLMADFFIIAMMKIWDLTVLIEKTYFGLSLKAKKNQINCLNVGIISLNVPFIAGDETGWMSVHEYIDQKNLMIY